MEYSGWLQKAIAEQLQTEAPAKMDRCVAEVYKKLLDEEKKKGDVSDKKKKELKSRSWAICTKQLESD